MKLVNQDENWLYYEGFFEIDGKMYHQKTTVCKLRPGTNVPMHINKVRFNKENLDG